MKGTLSLEDAKVLIGECGQDVDAYLKDTEGNKSLTYLLAYNGGNDNDDVLKYLVSKGSGEENDIVIGRLEKKYKKEFPGKTPIVCACEKGRFEDVKLLITGYNDVNGSNGNNNNNMTLKEYVNQVGKTSSGGYGEYTPLMAAAENEHFQIVKYLIEQGEADPNIATSYYGYNALHLAASNNKKDTELIEFLLTNMPLTS